MKNIVLILKPVSYTHLNWHFGSAVSLVLAVIVIALMALIYKAEKRTNMSNEDEEGGSRRNGKRKKIRKSTLH